MLNPPQNFKLKAEVVSILTVIDDKILLLQRLPSHAQANLWCFPGGKIEQKESPPNAAIRELYEETGILTQTDCLINLGKFYVRYPNGDFIFNLFKLYLDDVPNIKIDEKEHQAYCLCTLEQARKLPLTPGLDECFNISQAMNNGR